MANYVALSSETHRTTRVVTDRGARYGEDIHFLPVIADELRHLVLDYPVFLMKDPQTGQFGLFALLGFEPGENLFLEGDRWDAAYLPAHVRRQPFMVAFRGKPDEVPKPGETVVTIDMDSERVRASEGERLFDDEGKATPYLERISQILSGLVSGMESSRGLIDQLAEHDLIESAQLNITFADGEQKRFEGLYTINEEKYRDLGPQSLDALHRSGALEAATLMTASVGHVQKLIDRRNERKAASSAS